jgi:hypothetical protein
VLERDAENTWLTLEEEENDVLTQLQGASVTYRIATGPQQGRKVFTLQTIPSWEDDDRFAQVAKASGFSQAGCPGAETESKPDPVPRRIRAQQQTPGRCDAG